MKILAPFISCLLEPSDQTVDGVSPLDQAIQQGYTQIFLSATDGYYKYHLLRPGANGKRRFVCLPVKEIPGVALPKVSAGVEFLPAGKIPMELFDEVKEFFRQVITKKGRALEAMIWVLWDEANGYYLHVPNQTVGHASAHYDWASLPDGASIIVDIHSHADFGAFFSSTDDRDDTGCIRFSGVIGHNDKAERSMKFRFNYLGQRLEVQLTDLFERKEPAKVIPDAWMDQVHVNSPTMMQGRGFTGSNPAIYQGSYGMSGPYHGGQRIIHTVNSDGKTSVIRTGNAAPQQRKSGGTADNDTDKESESLETPSETRRQRKLREKEEQKILRQMKGKSRQRGLNTKTSESLENLKDKVNQEKGGSQEGERFLDRGNSLVPVGNGSLTGGLIDEPTREEYEAYRQYWEGMRVSVDADDTAPDGIITQTGPTQEEMLGAQAEEYLDRVEKDLPENFDTIAINHGIQVARAYTAVDAASEDLMQAPEVMKRCVEDMFQLLDESVKLKTFRQLADMLSSKDRDNLMTNGLG